MATQQYSYQACICVLLLFQLSSQQCVAGLALTTVVGAYNMAMQELAALCVLRASVCLWRRLDGGRRCTEAMSTTTIV